MKIDALNLNTEDFIVEHLHDSIENQQLVNDFVASNNARGLESYLKLQADIDEDSNGSRTYLVKDAETGKLACYFSLRSGLIAVRREDDLFDTIPAIELANFAVNNVYRSDGGKIARVGAYAFRKFVQPIVKCVADLIGVKYLYIYALPEGKLIQYYNWLGFVRLPHDAEAFVYSHVKPAYDQGCIFMYQEV